MAYEYYDRRTKAYSTPSSLLIFIGTNILRKTDANGNKYVEAYSDTFSVFGYTLTNT